MIPKKLKIGGLVYKVIETDEENIEADGDTDTLTSTIRIRKKLPPDQKEVTLLHEILHATNSQFNSNDTLHALMESIAQQLYQVLKDNKMLK